VTRKKKQRRITETLGTASSIGRPKPETKRNIGNSKHKTGGGGSKADLDRCQEPPHEEEVQQATKEKSVYDT